MKKIIFFFGLGVLLVSSCARNENGGMGKTDISNVNTGTGKAGSLSTFAVNGNYLYILVNNQLKTFDISTPNQISQVNTQKVDRVAETIFLKDSHLFVGTQTGMVIYDVANPSAPQYISAYAHAVSCDPVVVDGDYAYITLRDGTPCRRAMNRMEVVNISNITSPYMTGELEMVHPFGLAAENNTVYVCEDDHGVAMVDVSDKSAPRKLYSILNHNARDIILNDNIMMVIGSDGLYQYDYSDPQKPKYLSKLPVEN